MLARISVKMHPQEIIVTGPGLRMYGTKSKSKARNVRPPTLFMFGDTKASFCQTLSRETNDLSTQRRVL